MTLRALAKACAALALAVLLVLLCLASADTAPAPVSIPPQADGTCPPGTLSAANLQTGGVECQPDPNAPPGSVPAAGGNSSAAGLQGAVTPAAGGRSP